MKAALARVRAVVVKELRQVLRDPRMRMVLFVVPIAQLMVFTYAATTDVRHVATAVLDRDASALSRDMVARFEQSGYFDVVARPATDAAARALLDAGTVRALIEVPPAFERDATAGRGPAVMFAADGTDANAAALITGYALRITAAYATERAGLAIARTGRPPPGPPLTLETRAWYNPNLESRPFYVPGVLVMLITIITLMLTAMAIVREREIGTLEQLLVTPLQPIELLLGKIIPFALIGLIDAALVLGVATWWFEVPLHGSLLLFFAAVAIYLTSTLAAGLLISTLSSTQQQAMMGAFVFAFPCILLSGFMFPLENMPPLIQALTALNPLRYMMTIMRALFLKGADFSLLWPSFAALVALGVVIMGLGVWRFRKTLA